MKRKKVHHSQAFCALQWLACVFYLFFAACMFCTLQDQQKIGNAYDILTRERARVCVCVCPPLDKGFSTATPSTVFQPPFSTTFYRQGGREDLQSSAQRRSLQDPRKRKLITSVYLLPELLTTLSNLLCLIPWFFMLPTPKPIFPPQTCSRLAAALSVRFFECTCKHC